MSTLIMVPNCQPRPCALTGQFPFVGTTLTRAVTSTFERRKTRINPPLPPGLSHCFLANETRAAQWRAYLDRNKLPDAPHDSARAGKRIHAFLDLYGPRSLLARGSTIIGSRPDRGGLSRERGRENHEAAAI